MQETVRVVMLLGIVYPVAHVTVCVIPNVPVGMSPTNARFVAFSPRHVNAEQIIKMEKSYRGTNLLSLFRLVGADRVAT